MRNQKTYCGWAISLGSYLSSLFKNEVDFGGHVYEYINQKLNLEIKERQESVRVKRAKASA